MFSIHVDRAHDLIEVEMEGMLMPAEVSAYVDALRQTFVRERMRSYAMLIDVTRCPIQSQETVRVVAEHMAAMPKARMLAIVTGSSLSRMQIRRLFTQPYARICATREEGRAWAIAGTEPVAA